MAVNVILNGVTYEIPETGETGWGDSVTTYLQAVSTGVLTKAGGTFTLTQDVNLGANYGVLSKYFKTRSSNPSSAGVVRLSNAETIGWRNAANSGDLLLTVNPSGQLTFNGVVVSTGSALTAADVANVPSGNLVATNVQDALNELQTEIDDFATSVTTDELFAGYVEAGASGLYVEGASTFVGAITGAAASFTTLAASGLASLTTLSVSGLASFSTQISATSGIASAFYKSTSTNLSSAGALRMARTDTVGWRNQANSADLLLAVNASNQLTFNGVLVLDANSSISNAQTTGTASNTADTLVLRNGSGGFSMGALSATNVTSTGLAALNTVTANDGQMGTLEITSDLDASAASVSALSLTTDTINATATNSLTLTARKADGATNEGIIYTTDTTWSTNGGKPHVFKSGANTLGWFGVFGDFTVNNLLTASGVSTGAIYASNTGQALLLQGAMPNGATAVAVKAYTPANYTTSGANIMTFENPSATEKLAITKDGNLDWLNGTAFLNYVTASSKFVMTKSLDVSSSGTGYLYTDYVEAYFDVNCYGSMYAENGLTMNGGTLAGVAQTFCDVYQPHANKGLAFYTNATAADSGPDVLFETTVTRTAGTLFQLNNNAAARYSIGYAGQVAFGSVGDSTGTPGNATLNTPTGRSKVASGQASLTITNALIASANAHVVATLEDSDVQIRVITHIDYASGSFTIHFDDVAAANPEVRWTIVHAG